MGKGIRGQAKRLSASQFVYNEEGKTKNSLLCFSEDAMSRVPQGDWPPQWYSMRCGWAERRTERKRIGHARIFLIKGFSFFAFEFKKDFVILWIKYEKELWNEMIIFPNGPEFGPCLPISSFNIAKFLDLFLCFGNCESLRPFTVIKSSPSLVEKRTLKQILIYFLYQCQNFLTKKKKD